MGKVRYSQKARDDLFDSWLYIASLNTADSAFDRIEQACLSLVAHPRLGSARPDIGEGARALVIGRWIAFYRLHANGVQIVRIVDGGRDLKRIEWPGRDTGDREPK